MCIGILLMASCNKNRTVIFKGERLVISSESNSKLLLSEYSNDVSTVKLNLKQGELIGNVDQLIVKKDRFYIRDKVSKTVWVFNLSGSLIYKINNYGKGPGEYSGLDNILVDEKKKELLIFDQSLDKVIYYNLLNGNYKKQQGFEYSFKSVIKDNNKFFVHTNKAINFEFKSSEQKLDSVNFNLIVFDENFKCLEKKFPYDTKMHPSGISFSFGEHFSSYKDSYLFMESFNDTIFSIKNEKLTPKCIVDFENKEKIDFYHLNRSKFYEKLKDVRGAFMPGNFVETCDLYLFSFFNCTTTYYCIYDKESKRNCSGLLIDDINGCLGRYKANRGRYLYYVVDENLLVEHIDYVSNHLSNFGKDYLEKCKKTLHDLKESKNPIIKRISFEIK
jgi:hypothetical protein